MVWDVQMANAVAQWRAAHWAAGGRMVQGILKAARDAAGRRVSLGVAGGAEMCGGRMNPPPMRRHAGLWSVCLTSVQTPARSCERTRP